MPDRIVTQDKFNGTCDVTLTLNQEETRAWRNLTQAQRKSLTDRFAELLGGRAAPRLADATMPVGKDSMSQEAAKKAAPKFSGKVKTVFDTIHNTASLGLTDEEGQEILVMSGNSYRPARRALVKLGLVAKSGEYRLTRAGNNANVWITIATPSDIGGNLIGDE